MKTLSPTNPFLLTGYISPDYFCDRVSETLKIISALQNGRNITLISPRRMGKTGLIHHTFHQMMQSDGDMCYYVDLSQTDSLTSLVQQLGKVVLGTLDTHETKLIKRIGQFFKSLRPVIAIDPVTGEPSFSVNVQTELAEKSLMEIFSYIEHSSQQCFIAFDEFQVVSEYVDKKVEAILRSHIQNLTHVHFIFSGSQRHVLENMFCSASRPFYQSTQIMHLDTIDVDAYYEFASVKFAANGQFISKEDFRGLYTLLFGHTWYLQMILNRLYETKEELLDENTIQQILHDVVDENDATFQTFMRLLTPAQRKLLRAVAMEGSIKEIMSQRFISTYHLGAASTVKSATKALVEKELLLDTDNRYEVYDRFQALWLRK